MKVLVCGGREYMDESFVYKTLDEIHKKTPITLIIEGGARGVDSYAQNWWECSNIDDISLKTYPADWKKYGMGAGPIRNKQMLDEGKPDLVVAFPGGVGTADMVRRAKWENVPVIQPVRGMFDD